jgi:ketosteroid isomerase-like protein
MSEEHVELVRGLFEAHRTGGIEAVLPSYPNDVVVLPGPEWIEDAVYHGHDGMRKLEASFADNFDAWGWEVHEIRDLGDRVVALVEMTGRIKGSGVAIRAPQGIVLSDFRGDQVGEVRFFGTWQEALKAVRLSR